MLPASSPSEGGQQLEVSENPTFQALQNVALTCLTDHWLGRYSPMQNSLKKKFTHKDGPIRTGLLYWQHIPQDAWPRRALSASLCGRSVVYLSKRGAQHLISTENLDLGKRKWA